MKIAITPHHLLKWQGGYDFFSLLVDSLALALKPEDEVRVLLISDRDTWPWRIARIAKRFLTQFPPELAWAKAELFRPAQVSMIRDVVGDRFETEIVESIGTTPSSFVPDVAGPWQGKKPSGGQISYLGYIPDCQHRSLPEYFSPRECRERDLQFAQMLSELPVVIVNGRDAKGDLLRYFPEAQSEIVSLPFAPAAQPAWFQTDSIAVRERYGLPVKYFLCSNQFWQHKNHSVLIEAIARARAQARPVCVVFTGLMEDYRAPNYVRDLLARVTELGIEKDCRFLGLIPKLDQIAIMRSAIAVVQPTLFEGWPGGGAVYDAIAIGCPVIVSDIPINREIEEYVDAYFSPDDPVGLLDAMRRLESATRQERPAAVLLEEGTERRRRYGAMLRDAFLLAMTRSASF